MLSTAHPAEWQDVIGILRAFEFRWSEVLKGGGRKSVIAKRIDTFLEERGWKEKKFTTKIRVDAVRAASVNTPENPMSFIRSSKRARPDRIWNCSHGVRDPNGTRGATKQIQATARIGPPTSIIAARWSPPNSGGTLAIWPSTP